MDTTDGLLAERAIHYGPPEICFGRIVRLQAVIAECPDPLTRSILGMVAVKMARLIESPEHRDSWTDLGGYARIGERLKGEKDG